MWVTVVPYALYTQLGFMKMVLGLVLLVPMMLCVSSAGKKTSIYHLTNDNEASAVKYSDMFTTLSSLMSLGAAGA